MTRDDLLTLFDGTPDAPLRFLRTIARDGDRRCFAGNHNVRRILADRGLITSAHVEGNWFRLSITDNGQEVINAA